MIATRSSRLFRTTSQSDSKVVVVVVIISRVDVDHRIVLDMQRDLSNCACFRSEHHYCFLIARNGKRYSSNNQTYPSAQISYLLPYRFFRLVLA